MERISLFGRPFCVSKETPISCSNTPTWIGLSPAAGLQSTQTQRIINAHKANIVLEQDLLPRLRPLCSQHHLTLTMYQDDLTISGGARLRSLGNLIQRILLQSGYPVNVDKTRISNPGQRHMSTGLVYNTKPNIPKERYRALRGELHRCLTNGVITEAVDRPIWQYKHHLASRIEHVRYHNPSRANNLQIVFDRIDWGI